MPDRKKIPIFLILAGFLVAAMEDWWHIEGLVYPGMILIGFGVFLYGTLETIGFFQARSGINQPDLDLEAEGNSSSWLSSLPLMVFGMLVMGLALLAHLNWLNDLTRHIAKRPGVAIMTGGFLLFFVAFRLILSPNEIHPRIIGALIMLPARITGLVILLVSTILLVLGILEIFSPTRFQGVIENIKNAVPLLLFNTP